MKQYLGTQIPHGRIAYNYIGTYVQQELSSLSYDKIKFVYSNALAGKIHIDDDISYKESVFDDGNGLIFNGAEAEIIRIDSSTSRQYIVAFDITFNSNTFTLIRSEDVNVNGYFLTTSNDGKTLTWCPGWLNTQKNMPNPFITGNRYLIIAFSDGTLAYKIKGTNTFSYLSTSSFVSYVNNISLCNGFERRLNGTVHGILVSESPLNEESISMILEPAFDPAPVTCSRILSMDLIGCVSTKSPRIQKNLSILPTSVSKTFTIASCLSCFSVLECIFSAISSITTGYNQTQDNLSAITTVSKTHIDKYIVEIASGYRKEANLPATISCITSVLDTNILSSINIICSKTQDYLSLMQTLSTKTFKFIVESNTGTPAELEVLAAISANINHLCNLVTSIETTGTFDYKFLAFLNIRGHMPLKFSILSPNVSAFTDENTAYTSAVRMRLRR